MSNVEIWRDETLGSDAFGWKAPYDKLFIHLFSIPALRVVGQIIQMSIFHRSSNTRSMSTNRLNTASLALCLQLDAKRMLQVKTMWCQNDFLSFSHFLNRPLKKKGLNKITERAHSDQFAWQEFDSLCWQTKWILLLLLGLLYTKMLLICDV